MLLFPVVGNCRNHLTTLYLGSARHGRKPLTCRWNFDAICCSSSGVTIFGFGAHVAISGCRSMLQSLVDTVCELALVENPRFAVEIVMISVVLSEIKYFWFGWPHYYFRLFVNVAFICGHLLWIWRRRCLVILPFAVSNIQKCHICEVYIFASQEYNAGSRKTSHDDVRSKPAT